MQLSAMQLHALPAGGPVLAIAAVKDENIPLFPRLHVTELFSVTT